MNEAAMTLRDAYLIEQIVSQKWSDDAHHVALASVAGADLIVSRNFRHIVHLEKVPHDNEVNRRCGYGEVAIHSPSEVIAYETKKKFDCVRMKNEAQQRRAEKLQGLTPEQRLEYYRREHELLVERQNRLKSTRVDKS